jgi:DNA mismatch endonuclease (patch repair protein)
MADWLSAEARSRIMRSIRGKDTKPEQAVRKYLFARGYRYRLHSKRLPGKPDLAFPGRKKVIFVHGCFWHQHGDEQCPIRVVPSSNKAYWAPKLRRNIARDAENLASLEKLGWKALVVWECELRQDAAAAGRKMKTFLGPSGSQK